MERKKFTQCNIEKHIQDFRNKDTECKICNSNRSFKRYYENKENYQIKEKFITKKIGIDYCKNKRIDK